MSRTILRSLDACSSDTMWKLGARLAYLYNANNASVLIIQRMRTRASDSLISRLSALHSIPFIRGAASFSNREAIDALQVLHTRRMVFGGRSPRSMCFFLISARSHSGYTSSSVRRSSTPHIAHSPILDIAITDHHARDAKNAPSRSPEGSPRGGEVIRRGGYYARAGEQSRR